MSNKVEFKVSVETATLYVNPDDYLDAWVDHWAETHDDEDPDDPVPDIDPDWLLEAVKDDLNDGEIDLTETFEGYAITVERAT